MIFRCLPFLTALFPFRTRFSPLLVSNPLPLSSSLCQRHPLTMSNDEEDTQQPSIRPPPSAPQLTDAQEKLRKLNNKLNQLTLRDGAEKIRTDSTQSITSLAQATGRSVGQVKLVVGVMSQVKKSRGANSYNAWAAEEMVNANSSKSSS